MKIIRRIAAVAVAAVMLFSLTSCLALDEMREHRIDRKEGGELVFNGKEYVALPKTDYTTWNLLFVGDIYWVCDEEVPVLLSNRFGRSAYYDKDLDIISAFDLYCAKEKYDEYSEMFLHPSLDVYAVIQHVLNDETGETEMKKVALSEELTAALNDALSGEPVAQEIADAVYSSGSFYEEIYKTDKDFAVVDPNPLSLVSLSGKWYVSVPGEGAWKIDSSVAEGLDVGGTWY